MSRRSARPNRPGDVVEHRGAPHRTNATTGFLGPRDPGPHGKTLARRRPTDLRRSFRALFSKAAP